MEIVAKKTDEWASDGIRAFEDCKALFERMCDMWSESPAYQEDKIFPKALFLVIFYDIIFYEIRG